MEQTLYLNTWKMPGAQMLKVLFILLNLLAFPGLGTLCSGRKKAGVCQLVLSVTGYALTLLGAGILVNIILHSGQTPGEIAEKILNGTLMPPEKLLMNLSWAIIGITLFGSSWVWAALTPQGRIVPPPIPQP